MNHISLFILACFLFFSGCLQNNYKAPSNLAFTANQLNYKIVKDKNLNYYIENIANYLNRTAFRSFNFPCKRNANISILKDTKIIAITPNKNTYISLGLLNEINSEGELSFILAHEFSHIYLCHHQRADKNRKTLEIEADKLALKIISAAGFDPRYAISALSNIYAASAKSDLSIYNSTDTHPNLSERIKKMSKEISGSYSAYRNNSRNFNKMKSYLNKVNLLR